MHGKILSSQALRTPFTALTEDISRLALFLDIDGTLIDIAPTPDAVAVPPGLAEALARLSARLDGALALVTGRAIATADELIAGGTIPVGGLHGAERRDAAGHIVSAVATPAFSRARARLGAETACWPGVICEDKGAAFAAHYRLAPEREGDVRDLMAELARQVGDGWMLQEGKQVIELRPRGRDKGSALLAFMAERPFHGRRPLAVGDDLTDEAMFAAANRLGGLSVRVGGEERPSLARARLAAPSDVRAWIERMTA